MPAPPFVSGLLAVFAAGAIVVLGLVEHGEMVAQAFQHAVRAGL